MILLIIKVSIINDVNNPMYKHQIHFINQYKFLLYITVNKRNFE